MMVAAGREKRGLRTKPLLKFKTQHVTVESKRTLQIGHLQVHMTNTDARIDGWWINRRFHDRSESS